jgi:phosphoribosylaminoimidazole-succinocarboxamide synthase/phosphoribosylcarboxyaminoimidazole (NCAIR) mutase
MPTTSIFEESTALQPIAEGKTKKIFKKAGDPARVYLVSKNDITARDGAQHDVMVGKAVFANQTACNNFRLLRSCGIPVAFEEQVSPNAFEAPACKMLPYEVVVRREAYGSYLKRAPHLEKGHIFPSLVLEFFLKTSGKVWKGHALPCDDPLMRVNPDGTISLFDPKTPDLAQTPAKPFLTFKDEELLKDIPLMDEMGKAAKKTFLVLEKAWQLQGRRLVDFKIEFGLDSTDKLLLADVIDNDSWRVVNGAGNHMDKQTYREGADLEAVAAKYREVAEITNNFTLPNQAIILWRGSEKDDLTPFRNALSEFGFRPNAKPLAWGLGLLDTAFTVIEGTCSAHKQPAKAHRMLQELSQTNPDSVIVAYIGLSNGAGPTLSANTTVPVITVPATVDKFPEDVWSSLRTPSNVPVMTVLRPDNAMRAALGILSGRNPAIYAVLRGDLEQRLTGFDGR